mmetsp:Transcript_43640/g.64780  ORF Transcript_43640/g.64780 Transcript_43640/m.64780 type:complete len:92 (+) Transcript_43640:552-827(+)
MNRKEATAVCVALVMYLETCSTMDPEQFLRQFLPLAGGHSPMMHKRLGGPTTRNQRERVVRLGVTPDSISFQDVVTTMPNHITVLYVLSSS